MLALEEQRQAAGCDDVACLAEIGGALGARYIVAGSVSRLEDRHFVNVRIIDALKADVVGSESEQFRGPPDELLVGMRFLVRRLLATPYEGQGRLRLAFSEDGARLRLDGADAGLTPEVAVPDDLAAGKHLVELEKDGYYPLLRETYVEPARVTSLTLSLDPTPTPWYRTWWFWTIAGVVAAGATTGIVVATQLQSTPSAGPGDAFVPPLPGAGGAP
jgi:hypothetical protein